METLKNFVNKVVQAVKDFFTPNDGQGGESSESSGGAEQKPDVGVGGF